MLQLEAEGQAEAVALPPEGLRMEAAEPVTVAQLLWEELGGTVALMLTEEQLLTVAETE